MDRKYESIEEVITTNEKKDTESLDIFLPTTGGMDIELMFSNLLKYYPNLKQVVVVIRQKEQYKQVAEYLKNSQIQLPLHANFNYSIPINEIVPLAEEILPIDNKIDCYNVHSIKKEDRKNLKYFEFGYVTLKENKKDVPIADLLEQVDQIVEELNKKGENDIQKVLLLDKFYHDNFIYDRRSVHKRNRVQAKIKELSKKEKQTRFTKKRLEKLINKRDKITRQISNSYYLLTNKKGVCSAFSELAYLVLNHPDLNIKTRVLTTYDHAFNSIEIDGKEYVYDFTGTRCGNLNKDSWFILNIEGLYNRMKLNIEKSKTIVKKKATSQDKIRITSLYFDICENFIKKGKEYTIANRRRDRFVNVSSISGNVNHTSTFGKLEHFESRENFSYASSLPLQQLLQEAKNVQDKNIEIEERKSGRRR